MNSKKALTEITKKLNSDIKQVGNDYGKIVNLCNKAGHRVHESWGKIHEELIKQGNKHVLTKPTWGQIQNAFFGVTGTLKSSRDHINELLSNFGLKIDFPLAPGEKMELMSASLKSMVEMLRIILFSI